MELVGKTALVFGAGGEVGCAVARAFAREGARLHLSGIRIGSVEALVRTLPREQARAYQVDATCDEEIRHHVDGVARAAGGIDVVFNAIGVEGGEVVAPSIDVGARQFMKYLDAVVPSQFLTSRAAARHMLPRGRGVIILMGATPAAGVAPYIAGASAAHAAIEGLARCLATEWSPLGVRVLCYRSAGMSDSRRIAGVLAEMARIAGMPPDTFVQMAREKALLHRMPTLAQAAEAITFLASDRAAAMTGAIVNGSCGEVLD